VNGKISLKGGGIVKSNTYKIIGFVCLVSSGFIYSLERITSTLSTSMIIAGYYSGQMTREIPEVISANFSDNFFVPLFFFLGLASLIYGLIKRS